MAPLCVTGNLPRRLFHRLSRIQSSVGHRPEYICIAKEYKPYQADNEGDKKEEYPDIVKRHLQVVKALKIIVF